MRKISVAYHLAREFGDNIEQVIPYVPGINMGPWRFNLKSLFQDCIGIHRTVSESFKEKEHFVRIQESTLWKTGRNLNFKCHSYADVNRRNELNNAGYDIVYNADSDLTEINFKYIAVSSKIKRADYVYHAKLINELGIWYYNTNE